MMAPTESAHTRSPTESYHNREDGAGKVNEPGVTAIVTRRIDRQPDRIGSHW